MSSSSTRPHLPSTTPITTTTITISGTTQSDSANTILGTNIFDVGSTLFYVVIGSGSGILLLIITIIILLFATCLLAISKGRSYTLNTETTNATIISVQRQDVEREGSIQLRPQSQGIIVCKLVKDTITLRNVFEGNTCH